MSYLTINGGLFNDANISGGTAGAVLYVGSATQLVANDTAFSIDPTTKALTLDFVSDSARVVIAAEASSGIAGIQLNTLGNFGANYAIEGDSSNTWLNIPGASGYLGFFKQDNQFGRMTSTGLLLNSGTLSPTHTFTVPSVGTGYAHYNTTDQTTNYERSLLYWSSNEFTIQTAKGGSGANRAVRVVAHNGNSLLLGYNGTNVNYIQTNSTNACQIDGSQNFSFPGTIAPTHTLSLQSTATGFVHYNTTDQTTNYERLLGSWVSNAYILGTQSAGTGTTRAFTLRSSNTTALNSDIILNRTTTPFFNWTLTGSGASSQTTGNQFQITPLGSASSGTQVGAAITPTWNQTSTAGTTDFLINRTNTALGSGTHLFANFQISASTKLSVDTAGLITTNSTTMIASNQAFTNGAGAAAGTLLNAPVAGNPTKWIPINDNGTTRYIPAW